MCCFVLNVTFSIYFIDKRCQTFDGEFISRELAHKGKEFSLRFLKLLVKDGYEFSYFLERLAMAFSSWRNET